MTEFILGFCSGLNVHRSFSLLYLIWKAKFSYLLIDWIEKFTGSHFEFCNWNFLELANKQLLTLSLVWPYRSLV